MQGRIKERYSPDAVLYCPLFGLFGLSCTHDRLPTGHDDHSKNALGAQAAPARCQWLLLLAACVGGRPISTREHPAGDVIDLPRITLEWSPWTPWATVALPVHAGGVRIPNIAGVYEARYADQDERLTIGKASWLRMRVKQGLVKGHSPHSAGRCIRALGDTERVVVRWAPTDRPAAVEEELHRRHVTRFGRLPRCTSF